MTEPNLITSVVLQGREYLVKMNVVNKYLELVISDKQTGEEWQCSYDNSYIENLTHKTGNFKQFDIFVTMIKSGLLKTSDCITLELLTFEDLDTLRTKKIRSYSRHFNNAHGNNRRYLIVTYNVEFDRIHYPLPLEYCGPPDPTVLQATIRKLECELSKAREELSSRGMKSDAKQMLILQRRIDEMAMENADLRIEISDLQQIAENGPRNQVKMMQKAIVNLEKSVLSERKSHHQLVEKLRGDKVHLLKELEKCRNNEKSLRVQLDELSRTASRVKTCKKREKSDMSLETIYRRPTLGKAKSDDARHNSRTRSLSPRLTKSEDYEHIKGDKSSLKKKPTKTRSRSSSLSSSRNYDLDNFFALESDAIGDKQSPIRRRPRKCNKLPRSRSSSAGSSENSRSDRYKTSAHAIKTRLRSSDRDFLALETRIQALQDILKENTKSNDI